MKVIGNVPLVFIQRLQETRKNIVKRNIVIAGNDDLRLGKASRKARASRNCCERAR